MRGIDCPVLLGYDKKMTTVELTYDPFQVRTELTVDGNPIHLDCLGSGEGRHLSEWKNDFFLHLIKKLNKGPGSSCALIYYGLQEDYDELLPVHTAYCEKEPDIIINFEYGPPRLVTLAEKEALAQKLFDGLPGKSPVKGMLPPDFSTRAASIRNNKTPAFKYLEPAEKLYRVVTDYRQLIDALELRKQLEKELLDKEAGLKAALEGIAIRKKLEAESLAADLDEWERKIAASEKEVIEAVFEKNRAAVKEKVDGIRADGENLDFKPRVIYSKGDTSFHTVEEEESRKIINAALETLNDTGKAGYRNALNNYIAAAQSCGLVTPDNFPEEDDIDAPLSSALKLYINEKLEQFEKAKAVPISDWQYYRQGFKGMKDWGEPYQVRAGLLCMAFRKALTDGKIKKTRRKYSREEFANALLTLAFNAILDPILDEVEKESEKNAQQIKKHFSAELNRINMILKKEITAEREKRWQAVLLAADAEEAAMAAYKNEAADIEKRLSWLSGYMRELAAVVEL
jgi:hypothetical protein